MSLRETRVYCTEVRAFHRKHINFGILIRQTERERESEINEHRNDY